jgi:ribosomal protein S18 acetylase RimI-like enzyme
VTGVTIRRAAAGDAQAILDCLRAAFEPYRDGYTPGAFGDTVPTLAGLVRRAGSMCLFVAVTAAGEVVGTVACQVIAPDEGHLRGMAVHPLWQGRGVADRLLAAVEGTLRQQGCARISLDTVAPLQRAVRFYERHGFHPSGRVRDFFGMPLYEYLKEAR